MKGKYEKVAVVGRGTFGEVFSARRLSDGEPVAIKSIRKSVTAQGVDFTAVREIKTLYGKSHPNMVNLLDVVSNKSGDLFLIFELMECDLEDVIAKSSAVLEERHVKYYAQGMLAGLRYLHERGVLHRDIKPNNVLLRRTRGREAVKLGDMGMAREYVQRFLTPGVVTLEYRCPELLFGAKRYTPAVDNWAVGVIVGEMVLRRRLFPARSEIDLLSRIFHLRGTPTDRNWPARRELPTYLEFDPTPAQPLAALFATISEAGIQLIGGLMQLDPLRRLSAASALQSAFFSEEPAPEALYAEEEAKEEPQDGEKEEEEDEREKKRAKT